MKLTKEIHDMLTVKDVSILEMFSSERVSKQCATTSKAINSFLNDSKYIGDERIIREPKPFITSDEGSTIYVLFEAFPPYDRCDDHYSEMIRLFFRRLMFNIKVNNRLRTKELKSFQAKTVLSSILEMQKQKMLEVMWSASVPTMYIPQQTEKVLGEHAKLLTEKQRTMFDIENALVALDVIDVNQLELTKHYVSNILEAKSKILLPACKHVFLLSIKL